MFVTIKINTESCDDDCRICVETCPLDIFRTDGGVTVVEENEDECTFCNLCIERCPKHAITIIKNY